jgi:hypothetical protein
VGQFFIDLLNNGINGLGSALTWVLQLLPPSPFQALDNSVIQPYLSGLNWFVPISQMLAAGELWLTAIGIFYIYQAVLRWIKAIGD